MEVYRVRVALPQGGFVDVEIRAQSPHYARQIAESQYGLGSFRGFV